MPAYECTVPYRSTAATAAPVKRGNEREPPLLRRFFKCRNPECRRTFTVTSRTTWDSHKLSSRDLLLAVAFFQQARLGAASLELTRVIGCTYPVALVIEAKIREAIEEARGMPLLTGEVKIDGTRFNVKTREPNIIAMKGSREWQAYREETQDREYIAISLIQNEPFRFTYTSIMPEDDRASTCASDHVRRRHGLEKTGTQGRGEEG